AYGFNKAHAASYGMVAYQTAYMKANFPVEYMTAFLTAESGDKEKISAAINECRRMGIKVLPPDINESGIGFEIVNDKDSLDKMAIRFGFSAIKNVGVAAIEAILSVRESGKFLSLPDFLSRIDNRKVNKKVLESLIKVGALGEYGNRAAILSSIDSIREKVTRPKGDDNQGGLFASEDIIKTSPQTLAVNEMIEELSQPELESLERQFLGFSLSGRTIKEIVGSLELQATHKIYELSGNEFINDTVSVAAVVSEIRVILTKKTGAEMAFAKIDDGTGIIETVVFPKIFKDTRDFWTEGQPLLIHARVDLRDENVGLIVESIETLANLKEKKQREVYIRVPKNADANSLKRLKELLTGNLGSQIGYLVFEEGKKVKLPFKIAWNETLAKSISGILEARPS
ncbi:MAG: OB-fold nucleic acid binding domain-containing protein, partial [bacterium]|nr:OB-fold nucleic acid binding domain-containing protein [bacterium]